MIEKLTDANFLIFAAQHYDNFVYHTDEDMFLDLNRIRYVKKLLTRYVETGDLKERLILNHIIVLNNCFGPEATCKILLLKLRPQFSMLKPFLLTLNILPPLIRGVGDEPFDTESVPADEIVSARLAESLR